MIKGCATNFNYATRNGAQMILISRFYMCTSCANHKDQRYQRSCFMNKYQKNVIFILHP